MKTTKTANKTTKITLSKKEWTNIGKKAGWIEIANTVSQIIENIKNGTDPHFGYSHFHESNMSDYDIMSGTINDMVEVYGVNEEDAIDIINSLTHKVDSKRDEYDGPWGLISERMQQYLVGIISSVALGDGINITTKEEAIEYAKRNGYAKAILQKYKVDI